MPQTALTRRERKDLTRRRLVDGTIELLRAEGVNATTTGRIARAAGIKQSSFYGHFADRDECLSAAADHIGGYVLSKVRKQRQGFVITDLRGSIEGLINAVLDAFLSAPELTRIFLRYRADDDSPLGVRFRAMVAAVRAELKADFQTFNAASSAELAATYAELFVAGTLGLVEGLLDGRIQDRHVVIDGVVNIAAAAFGRKETQ